MLILSFFGLSIIHYIDLAKFYNAYSDDKLTESIHIINLSLYNYIICFNMNIFRFYYVEYFRIHYVYTLTAIYHQFTWYILQIATEYCGGGKLVDMRSLPFSEHNAQKYIKVVLTGKVANCIRLVLYIYLYVNYMYDLVSAINYLHDRGCVHRNLKVANLSLVPCNIK